MSQQLKDSGERREFASGAVRDRGELKPRPDLISPHADLREGMIFALGAQKYAIRNWEKGMPISECIASAERHIKQFKRGDIDEDHLAQARWNLGAIIHYEEEIRAGRLDPALDDMPKYAQQKPTYIALPPCPVCSGEMTPTSCSETGPECYCKGCGLTSLDAPPLTFYIAGPMRGYEQFNFPMFDLAAKIARGVGVSVISPAELDRAHGFDPSNDSHIDLDMRVVAQRDCEAILGLDKDNGDGLILLPRWEASTGARAEVALALWLGLKFQLCLPEGALLEMDSSDVEGMLFNS